MVVSVIPRYSDSSGQQAYAFLLLFLGRKENFRQLLALQRALCPIWEEAEGFHHLKRQSNVRFSLIVATVSELSRKHRKFATNTATKSFRRLRCLSFQTYWQYLCFLAQVVFWGHAPKHPVLTSLKALSKIWLFYCSLRPRSATGCRELTPTNPWVK